MRRDAPGETKRTPDAEEDAVTTAACAARPCCCETAASCAAALPVRTIAETSIEKIRRAVPMIFYSLLALRRKSLPNPPRARTPSKPGEPFTELTRKQRPNGITPRRARAAREKNFSAAACAPNPHHPIERTAGRRAPADENAPPALPE